MFEPEVFKIDNFVAGGSWAKEQFARAVRLPLTPGCEVPVASPEDMIVAKCRWFDLGARVSDKHWNDLVRLFEVQRGNLETAYIERWLGHFGLMELWIEIQRQARAWMVGTAEESSWSEGSLKGEAPERSTKSPYKDSETMAKRLLFEGAVSVDPQVLSGAPVFAGTRVPIKWSVLPMGRDGRNRRTAQSTHSEGLDLGVQMRSANVYSGMRGAGNQAVRSSCPQYT